MINLFCGLYYLVVTVSNDHVHILLVVNPIFSVTYYSTFNIFKQWWHLFDN